MPKICWADEYVCYLIDSVQKVNHVWDCRNPRYKNKAFKRQFWCRLVTEMNRKFRPSVPFTNDEVVRKWNNIKSYYAIEAQKDETTQKCNPSDESTDNIRSCWKYKTRLDFLLPVQKPVRLQQLHTNLEKKQRRSYSLEDSSEKSGAPPIYGSVAQNEIIKTEALSEISLPMSTGSCEYVDFDEDNTEETKGIAEKYKVDTSIASANSAFASCILAEMDKLDPDLQLTAKTKLFSIIMDLQAQQLKRNQE